MPYIPFYELCRETAKKETRVITLFDKNNEFGLPTGEYAFMELFCDECDCRRVFFDVMKDGRSAAVIAWGWESYSFYKKWWGRDDNNTIKEFQGPDLNLMSPQSKLAPGILVMFKNLLIKDKLYSERVKKHYTQFRKELKNSQ